MLDTVSQLVQRLRTRYPVVKTQLVHQTPFQLLIATILSAQCTDAQVNRVTPGLFARFPDSASLAGAKNTTIEKLIFSTGFYRNKTRNIKACAKAIEERHQGIVPRTLEDLTALPGVGRKTANVLLSTIHGIQTIVVDTHVARISRRLGLTASKNPTAIEFDLMAVLPETDWNDFSLWLIYLGREICRSRNPLCPGCLLEDLCPKVGVPASSA
ncbi:MAG: endonuclease III [Pseudomonadota bacterium]